MTDVLPDDDSFVRAAIIGLRVPSHGPDFWDQLAWHLDDAADELTAQGVMQDPFRSALSTDPDLLPEPEPHHVEDPWPEPQGAPRRAPLVAAPAAEEAAAPELDDLFAPVAEPVYDDEHDDDLADEAAAYDPTYDEPRDPAARRPDLTLVRPLGPDLTEEPPPPGSRRPLRQVHVEAPAAEAPAPRVRHDRATVPGALRKTSNAVLLAVAVLAVVVAAYAGLTLVKQRSDAAAPAPVPAATAGPDAPPSAVD